MMEHSKLVHVSTYSLSILWFAGRSVQSLQCRPLRRGTDRLSPAPRFCPGRALIAAAEPYTTERDLFSRPRRCQCGGGCGGGVAAAAAATAQPRWYPHWRNSASFGRWPPAWTATALNRLDWWNSTRAKAPGLWMDSPAPEPAASSPLSVAPVSV